MEKMFLTPYKLRKHARVPYIILGKDDYIVTYKNIVTGNVFTLPKRKVAKKLNVTYNRVLY